MSLKVANRLPRRCRYLARTPVAEHAAEHMEARTLHTFYPHYAYRLTAQNNVQAIDLAGKKTTEVIEAESTQANLRKVKVELEMAGAGGLDLISKQTLSALDGAAIPQETRANIRAKYEAAVAAAQKAEREVEKARAVDFTHLIT